MPITGIYSSVLFLLYFKITMATIGGRRRNQVSLGSGDNEEMLSLMSAHSNFAAYTPFFLIMLAVAEQMSPHLFVSIALHLISVAFIIGRLLHFKGLTGIKMDFSKRKLGMQLTLFPMLGLTAILTVASILKFMKVI